MKVEVRSSQESADRDPHQERVRKRLSVNFLVYRNMISKHLLDNPNKKVTKEALKEMHRDFAGYWHDMFDPDIAAGMGADEEFIKAVVGKYSGDLADQVNDVSDKAFIEGYNAALNKGWDKAVAWERISETYGVDPAQMRSWVLYYPEGGYHPEKIPKKSKEQSEKLLYERANRIATHEAWSLKQLGKQAEWTQKIMKGDLPQGTKKIWVTAKDELVCPVCAPMDNIVADVNDQFKTTAGKFFTPPVHINCRCEIYLQFDVVAKSIGDDRWNRDLRGRFSRFEQRSALPTKTRGRKLEEKTEQQSKLYVVPWNSTQERPGKTKEEPKAEVKAKVKSEAKTEAKTEANTNRKTAQQSKNDIKLLSLNSDVDRLIGADQLKDAVGFFADTHYIDDQVFVLERKTLDDGTDIEELLSRADSEQKSYKGAFGDPPAHFYVVNGQRDAEMRVEGKPANYVVTETVEYAEGDLIDPDLAEMFGMSRYSPGDQENVEIRSDLEEGYFAMPRDITVSRVMPFTDVMKERTTGY